MPYRFQTLMLIFHLLTGCACWGEDTYSIRGKVSNSETGMGIGRALVRIRSYGRLKPGAAVVDKELFSDSAGAFAFQNLARGSYSVVASKPQHVYEPAGSTLSFNLENNLEDIVVMMKPLGVIEGQVKDGTGRPMRGVVIMAFERQVINGRNRLRQLRSTFTNDQGMYRMWKLPAGKVFLKATGRTGGTLLYSTEQVPSFVSYESFSPVYQDGVDQFENASPIELATGQHLRADFRLRLEKAYRIRGVVRNLQPKIAAKFELLRGNEDVTPSRATLNLSSGAFEVHDVVAGTYRMRVTQVEGEHRVIAEDLIEVNSQDRAGVEMRAEGGMDLAITVQSSGTAPEWFLRDAGGSRAVAQQICWVMLSSLRDDRLNYNWNSREDALGLKAVLPGEYAIQANCNGAYVRALMMGSEDVLSKQKLVVLPGTARAKLELQTDWNGGRLEFEKLIRPIESTNRVMMVPQFTSAAGVQFVRGFEGSNSGLAPGEYLLYLIKGEDIAYRESAAIGMLKNGVRVRINAGETSKVSPTELLQ
jgi:hypothetical protein